MKNTFLCIVLALFLISCNKSDETPAESIPFEVGDLHEGGIIFYIDSTGNHGLIASQADQGEAIWGCIATTFPTAQNNGIGFGKINTEAINTNCTEDLFAAKICTNLSLNGFTDWFLPSIDELEIMYAKRNVIGGFDESNGSVYVSSSEFYPSGPGLYLNSWVYDFGVEQTVPTNRKLNSNKDNPFKIRAIRAF